MRYRDVVFYAYVSKTSGVPSTQLVGDAAALGIVVSTSGTTTVVTLPTGVILTVVSAAREDIFYLDVFVSVPRSSYIGRLHGMVGFYDGVKSNDLRQRNGVIVSNNRVGYNKLMEAWRVPGSENLFKNPKAIIPPIFGGLNLPKAPICPTTGRRSTTSTPIPVETTSPLADCTTENGCIAGGFSDLLCEVFTDSALEAAAQQACTFSSPCCPTLDTTTIKSDCMCDYNAAKGPAFLFSSRLAFSNACEKVKTTCSPCPANCNDNGQCMDGQCQCNSGFGGNDCSEDHTACTKVLAVSPNEINAGCGQTLLVSGLNFFGSQVHCEFTAPGSVISVPAEVISAFQVYCTVPDEVVGPMVQLSIRATSGCSVGMDLDVMDDTCCAMGCDNGGTCDMSDDMMPVCLCAFPYAGDDCSVVGCKAETSGNAEWPVAAQSTQVAGTCITGTQGSVKRTCGSGSTYGPITGSCKAINGPVVITVNTPSYLRNSQTRRKMYVTINGMAGSKTVLFNSATGGIPVGTSTATFNVAVGEVMSLTFGTYSGDFWTFDQISVTSWGMTKSSQGVRVVSVGSQVTVTF